MERGTKATTTLTAPELSGNSRVHIAPDFSTGRKMLVQNSNQQNGKKRRDDTGDIPRFHFYSEAGFAPYLGSIFV